MILRSGLVLGLMLAGTVGAQAADADKLQQWIAQLNDQSFAVREHATSELILASHEKALDAVVGVAEKGSPEAHARALLVLGMWHRSDETSRIAVVATAKRWQDAKSQHVVRMGKQLAAMTAPKPVRPNVPSRLWVGGGGEGVILLDGAAVGLPVAR